MLRQDYFLRIVEKFAQMLMQIRERIESREYADAEAGLDQAFRELLGLGPDKISELTETELLARLTMDGPTHALKEKTRVLVALLQEAGLLHAAQGRDEAARACWLQALNLLLTLQLQDADGEFPEFVPTIALLREQLRETPLPLATLAALWRHYENVGAFAHAEDTLFALLDAQPRNQDLLVEARAFYGRLLRLGDASLAEGNLPRAEVAAGLAALPAASRL
jgi:hypothetical protein